MFRCGFPSNCQRGSGCDSSLLGAIHTLYEIATDEYLRTARVLKRGIGVHTREDYEEVRTVFRFSWKWRRRSPIKLMERTHEEETEAIRAGRESRHPEAALAGEGAHLATGVFEGGTATTNYGPLKESAITAFGGRLDPHSGRGRDRSACRFASRACRQTWPGR
jgi:hypothetical protein